MAHVACFALARSGGTVNQQCCAGCRRECLHAPSWCVDLPLITTSPSRATHRPHKYVISSAQSSELARNPIPNNRPLASNGLAVPQLHRAQDKLDRLHRASPWGTRRMPGLVIITLLPAIPHPADQHQHGSHSLSPRYPPENTRLCGPWCMVMRSLSVRARTHTG